MVTGGAQQRGPEGRREDAVEMVEVLVDVGAAYHRVAAGGGAEVARQVDAPDAAAGAGGRERGVEGERAAAGNAASAARGCVPTHDREDAAGRRVAHTRHVAGLVDAFDAP